MTPNEWILVPLILIVGLYAAWNIGANDVANAMGTSVGSKALTLKQAVVLAALFEFAGAYLVGANVSETVRKKMFDPELLIPLHGDKASLVLACGMIAALIATGTWLLIATTFRWPVSTTHSIVGAVVGFGCVGVGVENVAWAKVGLITAGWIASPLLSGTIAFLMFRLVLRRVFYKKDPLAAAKRTVPVLVGVVLIVLVGVATFKGLKPLWKRLHIDAKSPEVLLSVAAVALLAAALGWWASRRLLRGLRADDGQANPLWQSEISRSLAKAELHLRRVRDEVGDELQGDAGDLLERMQDLRKQCSTRMGQPGESDALKKVERSFAVLQVLTACTVAFAHGSNDVANAIGPMSAGYQAARSGTVALKAGVPGWALLLGGVGIALGLATWGWRVIRTVGEKITELTPSRGFCAEFAAAITILMASTLPIGLPVSTTHILVGAVIGIGVARGIGALNLRTAREIFASWAVTIPAGAGLSIVFYLLLKVALIDSGVLS